MNSVARSLQQHFFRPLYRHVSIYALEQLWLEHNRMLDLGDFVLNKCGCVLQRTHGLSCAYYLYMSIGSQGALYLNDIHPFWSTLTYTKVRDDTNEGVRYANADDKEYFQFLVDEVLKYDPAVVRRLSQVLEYELHSNGADIPEPYASPPRKGRRTTSKTLRRNKSAFEYSRSSSGGRGSRSSSRGRSSGRSSGRETQSSVGIKFSFNLSGDGNCGFRAIATTELGGEEAWPLLRHAMCMEMQMNRDQYLSLYQSQELLDDAIFRIGSHGNGPTPYIHWMDTPMTLYSAATFLNIGIAYYGSADGNSLYNCLVLPLRKASDVHSVNKVIHICWVNGNHFVQLLMNDDSSPLPPVHQRWREAVDNFSRHIKTHFTSRIMLWNKLCGSRPPQRNNTAEDAVNLDSP
ncbi:uncharacterized protein LOC130796755 isoform X2 [Amaranthus tricolor]|uniref:uncharacterized protein LOC130796755 isoform X2 n=1 Tax=Amaranthus tricolor TaxID=29722 RepID=UPI0025828C4D|nr:uncharacterized protein LOC130796755 isoform X2 [Amaranthus tricolor]